MSDAGCIFCGNGDHRVVIEEGEYKGRQCPQCGLIFLSPKPTLTDYENDQGLTSAELHISNAFGKRLQARHNIALIKKHIEKGTLLEIGCGAGYFLDEARREGFEVYGIEPNKIAADFILNNFKIPCEVIFLNENTLGGMKFNLIYHCNVLSHFSNPIDEFKMMNDRLKPDGLLVFETGNIADVEERYYPLFGKFDFPDHLFFFGEKSIQKLLDLTGFKMLKIYRYSILPYLTVHYSMVQRMKENVKTSIKATVKSYPDRKHLLKDAYKVLLFFIRYKVGYFSPKRGRPQTVVVAARKKKISAQQISI